MKNVGKVFEENFKKSLSKELFCYRPPDAAQSFDMSSKLRFSQHSPCDYMLFNGEYLFMFELKSVGEKSISFERTKNDKGVIHHYQIENLKKFQEYRNVIAGFLLDFRLSENTYYVGINDFVDLMERSSKKSFNEIDLCTYSSPILLNKTKLKVNYRYDVNKLLMDVIASESERN